MLIPPVIVIDESGPESGASVMLGYILIQEKNKEQVLEGFKTFMPNKKFKIFTKEEYKQWLTQLPK